MPPLVLFGSIFSPKSLNLPQGETSMAPGLDSRYTVPEKLGNSFVLFSEYIFTEGTVSNLNPKSLTGRVRRLIHGSWIGFGKTGTLHAPACYYFLDLFFHIRRYHAESQSHMVRSQTRSRVRHRSVAPGLDIKKSKMHIFFPAC